MLYASFKFVRKFKFLRKSFSKTVPNSQCSNANQTIYIVFKHIVIVADLMLIANTMSSVPKKYVIFQ